MNIKWDKYGKKLSWPIFRLFGTWAMAAEVNLHTYSMYPGWESNRGCPKYEAGEEDRHPYYMQKPNS
jgi:hypothetical protein